MLLFWLAEAGCFPSLSHLATALILVRAPLLSHVGKVSLAGSWCLGDLNGPCQASDPAPSWNGGVFWELFISCKRIPTCLMQVTLPWDTQRLFVKPELFPSPFLSESCGIFTGG